MKSLFRLNANEIARLTKAKMIDHSLIGVYGHDSSTPFSEFQDTAFCIAMEHGIENVRGEFSVCNNLYLYSGH